MKPNAEFLRIKAHLQRVRKAARRRFRKAMLLLALERKAYEEQRKRWEKAER